MLLKPSYIYLLLVLVTSAAAALSPKAKDALLQALRGVTLEKRQARLQNLGALYFGKGPQKGNFSSNAKKIPVDLVPNNVNDSSIGEINQREGVADYLFQGDINLSEEQLDRIEKSLMANGASRAKRQVGKAAALWTNNIVYYYFDASLSTRKRNMVQVALNYIQARTCLQFVQSSVATNRIRVFSGSGCYSSVGMLGGEQQLSLGDGCTLIGIVAHEFMHALGVWHMQMRDDRDNFVTIDLSTVPVRFSSTASYTILPWDAPYTQTIGSRTITFYDIKTINDHYKCHDQCGAGSAVCLNGGEPNPRNCSICNCPAGYGGATCELRPAGCGQALTATALWQVKQFTFGNAAVTTPRDTYMECNYRVQAPAGKQVQTRITYLKTVPCSHGCHINSIEPKVRTDMRATNPRVCCSDMLNGVFTSNLNPTPIIAYNRYLTSTFTFHYRYI
ncbi:astacin [Ancylostoma ceylanicum]|uniref:Zinc metalloproteinase n=1 Tax=Ancylostoma ceylanicum TaxID=53326 RepID=A0A0D6MBC3_9BILA|nr:astacin [Ancylostoma ceylanicum]